MISDLNIIIIMKHENFTCLQKVDKSFIHWSLHNVLDKNQAFCKKSAANIKVYDWLTFIKAEFNKLSNDTQLVIIIMFIKVFTKYLLIVLIEYKICWKNTCKY